MYLKEKWKAVVKDWRESGLSQADYCKKAGIKSNRLSYWKRKLSIEDAISAKSEIRVKNEFIEVGKSVNELIEINYGDLQINIPSSIESKKIAELINCLS